ncbi:hypothetical protein SHIRM173S_07119 [Streptomyces hirsutus]
MRTAIDVDTSTVWRKSMTSLIAFCSSQASTIFLVRLGPRPGTSISRLGSSSMTVRVSRPKCCVMRSAKTGPMPLTSPEPR